MIKISKIQKGIQKNVLVVVFQLPCSHPFEEMTICYLTITGLFTGF